MARMPRLVVPNYPHHSTQRGVWRMKTFCCADDYQYYLDLVSRRKSDAGVSILAYCNHVHFVAVPEEREAGWRRCVCHSVGATDRKRASKEKARPEITN